MIKKIKQEIRKFINSEHSAVTVIVTFLLIPAILITGTGVEFARIFANRTITENAGELAANAALTQYDAVLQDMYGLYAIAMTDEELSELLDAYVKAAFAEGDSTLLLNSGEVSGELNISDSNYYLSNKEILARQIQEYCKIRGIGALANDLIDKLSIFDFSKLKMDLDIFDKKLETDDQFKALLEQYEDFYYRMRYNDYFVESSTTGVISKLKTKEIQGENIANSITESVSHMHTYKQLYNSAVNFYDDEDELAEYKEECEDNFNEHKDEILTRIRNFDNDFPKFTHSIPDSEHKITDISERPWYVKVVADITGIDDLVSLCDFPGSKIEYYKANYESPDCLKSYTYNLEQIVGAAKAINKQIDEFKIKQTELNYAISKGSDLTQETMSNQTEVYNWYMNKIDVDGVVASIKDNNERYIDEYESYFTDSMFTYTEGEIGYNELYSTIDSLSLSSSDQMFDNAKGIMFIDFSASNEWEVFCKHTSDGLAGNPLTTNDLPKGLQGLYWTLALQYVNTDAGTDQSKVESAVNNIGKSITDLIEKLTKGIQPFPIGHDTIPDEFILPSQGTGVVNASASFELQLDKMGENNEETRNLIKELKEIISTFAMKAADNAVDKTLMTVYATHMFSNYATAKKESMAGYNFNAQLNYLQGAEQEYIIIGNRAGIVDLTAFGAIIVAIRTVLNFASTFVVPEINIMVNSVASAAAAVPFVGPALYLLVQGGMRLALAMGESLVDLYLLRKGKTVLLFKFANGQFVVGGPIGFVEFMKDLADDAKEKIKDAGVDLVKDLIRDSVSIGDMELEEERNPGYTSAKALDIEANSKFDNSSDIADLGLKTIDVVSDEYKKYEENLDKFAKKEAEEEMELQSQLYLSVEADNRGLNGPDRDDFISEYKEYIKNDHSEDESKNDDYEEIKSILDKGKKEIEDKIKNDIENPETNSNDENSYYNRFKEEYGTVLGDIGSVVKDKFKDTFKQFTPSEMIENLKKKFSLKNLLGVDYSFYSSVWMLLTVNRDDLIMRMADLISLNVANKSSKLTLPVGDYENLADFGYDIGYALTYEDHLANGMLPPMTKEIFDKYTLDKRRVFIQADVTYEMKWTFISLGLFQSDPMKTGITLPKTFPIRESVYRGY